MGPSSERPLALCGGVRSPALPRPLSSLPPPSAHARAKERPCEHAVTSWPPISQEKRLQNETRLSALGRGFLAPRRVRDERPMVRVPSSRHGAAAPLSRALSLTFPKRSCHLLVSLGIAGEGQASQRLRLLQGSPLLCQHRPSRPHALPRRGPEPLATSSCALSPASGQMTRHTSTPDARALEVP